LKLMFEYDLHTHTIFSDGGLVPAEAARRAEAFGYKGIALTDHADLTNFRFILENQLRLKTKINSSNPNFNILVGVEFTHVQPDEIYELKNMAKENGADIIIVHGETIVEPVKTGTNRAAIEAGVDILAHPGLISEEDASMAAKNNVYLEITTRKGHSLTNGHVAKTALKTGANLVINNDFHEPGDAVTSDMAVNILRGCGLRDEEIRKTFANNKFIFNSKLEV